MSSPLLEAVEAYLAEDRARFHMPGHKGRPLSGSALFADALPYDITEVDGADSLYEASGAIARTEQRYAALYGGAGALLSAGGSTLCIQTMLALATAPGDRILCGRGVHTAAVNAMALLDLHPVWIYPERDRNTGLSRPVSAEQVATALHTAPDVRAVYLTSPDYFGCMSDLAAISAVCRAKRIPLLVDNAHGAHLRFLSPDCHPLTLGADLCCDSLHKTLPVLTGGALLQVGNTAYLSDAKRMMSLFGSTSPSYLTLLSIDAALPYLETRVSSDLAAMGERVEKLEVFAQEQGFLLPGGFRDPTRLSLGFAPLGLERESFRAHLSEHGVEPEYLSNSFCVFLPGVTNTQQDFTRLQRAIASAPHRAATPAKTAEQDLAFAPIPRACSLREAVFAPSGPVPVEQAAGKICAGIVAPCPPGIPLALPGERLDANLCAILKTCGILSVNVIR